MVYPRRPKRFIIYENLEPAKIYYLSQETNAEPRYKRRKAKMERTFEVLKDFLDGKTYKELAFKYKACLSTVTEDVKRAEMYVENFIKIRGLNEDNRN